MVKALAPRVGARGFVEIETAGTVARENITGAATLDVAGHDAAELTVIGHTTGLTISGFDTDTTIFQRVRVQVTQNAVGGWTFDWENVNGTWVESPPDDLATDPDATILQFYAITTDGGATIWLEPIGVQYSMDCVYLQVNEVDVPAVAANGVVTFGHNYQMVSSVELIGVADGRRVLADWWQTPGDPASAVNIDFTAATPAGTYTARIAGLAAVPCDLTVTTSEWETINLALAGATSVAPRVDFTGAAGSVQWVWGDGNVDTATSGVATSHTYGAAYTGTATLRYRRGVTFSNFTDFSSPWVFDVGLLPRDITTIGVIGFSSALTGSVGNLPPNLLFYTVNGQNTVGGALADLPRTLLNFTSAGQNQVAGDVANLPAGLTVFSNTSPNPVISGDLANLPTGLTNFTVNAAGTTAVGDLANLPTTLTTLVIGGAAGLTGDVGNLPAAMTVYNNTGSNNATTGLVDGLPGTLTTFINTGGANTTSGDVANLPAGLTTYSNAGNNTAGGSVAALPAGLTTFISTGNSAPTGDIAGIPATITSFEIDSAFDATTLVGTYTPNAGLTRYIKRVNLASGDVDALLVAVDALGTSNGLIDLGGTNAAPGAAGATAAANLAGRGWTVTTN